MPTALHRVQVLMDPEVEAAVKTLAKYDRRSQSAFVVQLIEAALSQPKYQQMLKDAEAEGCRFAPAMDPRKRRCQPQYLVRNEEEFIDVTPIEPPCLFTINKL